ncbi:CU044_2847 family protein [Streptomyces sp. NPDC093097]|uniref:CU044_2847 family protein n=1 Tax=Streptomyces sp. NPDC093097 TaxID=3366027 RepID=UPI00382A3928
MGLIAVPLNDEDKEPTVFETDIELVGSDLELASGDAGVVARARVSLDDAMAQVRPTLTRVVDTLRELGPDEAEVEFGLKVGGDTSVIIAKGTAEVNFAVRLKWARTADAS